MPTRRGGSITATLRGRRSGIENILPDPILPKFAFASRPTIAHTDIVNNDAPGTASSVVDGVWSNAQNSFLAFPVPTRLSTSLSAVAQFTCVFQGTILSSTNGGVYISIPHQVGWSSPFGDLHFFQDGAGNSGRIRVRNIGDTTTTDLSLNGFVPNRPYTSTVAVKFDGIADTVVWWRDGEERGTNNAACVDTVFFSGQPIVIGNRSNTSSTETIEGTVNFVGIADSILSNEELNVIHSDPLGFL